MVVPQIQIQRELAPHIREYLVEKDWPKLVSRPFIEQALRDKGLIKYHEGCKGIPQNDFTERTITKRVITIVMKKLKYRRRVTNKHRKSRTIVFEREFE